MRLIAIRENGSPEETLKLCETATEFCKKSSDHFTKFSYVKPWVTYLASVDGCAVGTCSFKNPPVLGTVEIFFSIFTVHQKQGYASQVVAELIRIAQITNPHLKLTALAPFDNLAAGRTLAKNNFQKKRDIFLPDKGHCYEWHWQNIK